MPKLTVHDGKTGPREPVDRVQCSKCNLFLGIEVRAELMCVWIGPNIDENGELSGGSRVWVCARCHKRGEWTPIGKTSEKLDLETGPGVYLDQLPDDENEEDAT